MKQCPECRSSAPDSSPWCEACGFQFRHVRISQQISRWKYRLLAVLVGLVAAIADYLVFR